MQHVRSIAHRVSSARIIQQRSDRHRRLDMGSVSCGEARCCCLAVVGEGIRGGHRVLRLLAAVR
jgi:hypothetical protein